MASFEYAKISIIDHRLKFELKQNRPTCYCVMKLLVLFHLNAEPMLVFLSGELVVETSLILHEVNWIGSMDN